MHPAKAVAALLETEEDSLTELSDVNIIAESVFSLDTCVVVSVGTDGEVLFEESEGHESEFSSV